MLFGVFLGTVKASFPTTLSNNIEELRQGIHRNPHAFNQGLNESCKFFSICTQLLCDFQTSAHPYRQVSVVAAISRVQVVSGL